jgi:outer membrane protein
MERRKYLFILMVVLITFVSTGITQDELTLTLEKSVEYALQNNPELKMAEKELAKSKSSVLEAWSNIMPKFDASVNFQHAWDLQKNVIPNFFKPILSPLGTLIPEFADMPDYVEMVFGLENSLQYGATVSQPVFLGGAGLAGIHIANAAKRAAGQDLEENRQTLIYNTTNAFYACLLAKELVNVQGEALAQTKANLDNVYKKYKVGSASGFDKMRAEVEVANLKPGVITAKNNYQSALTMLKTILGLNRDAIINVKGGFKYVEDDFGALDLKELQQMAFNKRPLLKALESQKQMTKNGITIARSSFMPKLFFQTDYSYLLMRNDYKFRHADANKGFSSAVSLQIPLFHSFQSTASYQKSRLDYKIMLDVEKQAYDGIAAETEVGYNKFKEANEKYLSAVQTVDLAKEALRLANMMYEEGVNTQLDVMSSQLALTQAKLNYANSLYEYQSARYQLRKVVGILKGILD